ncbi:uncharacterized protein [Typha latifolia]|uniref:uncharacterized protein n=1 Tax=Typha latifolia TaxID=4733 RepID=UPI003C30AF86
MTAKYKRATVAFDEKARARLCKRMESEPSMDDAAELADLVNAFYESAGKEGVGDEREAQPDGRRRNCGKKGGDPKESLEASLAELVDDHVAYRIRVEVERAVRDVGSNSDGVKRRVVGRLRDNGFDAGLCKTIWEKTDDGLPSGSHDYIDVITRDGSRYMVDINLAVEFEIARPTIKYVALLQSLPAVFVAKPELLKAIIRVMCDASKESMKSACMHVPPWRREEYVLAKWFSEHKRTTNGPIVIGNKYSAGAPLSPKFCRVEIGCKKIATSRGKWVTAFRDM